MNVTKYCVDTNFGVYEVRPQQYREIIETCTTTASHREHNDKNLEYMGLITIREPLQRTVSQIHQQCNVHRTHLKFKERQICDRCKYSNYTDTKNYDGIVDNIDDDRSFFDHIANTTNEIYQEMKDMVDVNPDSQNNVDDDKHYANGNPKRLITPEQNIRYLDIPLFILNNEDMDAFFGRLEAHVTSILSKHEKSKHGASLSLTTRLAGENNDDDDGPYRLPRGRANSQKVTVVNNNATATAHSGADSSNLCDFAMPSRLMKIHHPSLDIYRWFQQRP
jgi:hypothetical protein